VASHDDARGGFAIQRELLIERDIDTVFAYLADTASFKAVDPALVEFEPAGRLVAGMTGRFLHRRGGLPARSTWVVRELDAPRRLVVEIAGMGYGMTEAADLEPAGGGTRVRFVDRVWPTSLPGRLMVKLSGGIMRRDLQSRAVRLRGLLESQPPDRM
jgi:uncharacterized protein YndB with AHSA1/START domain